MIALVNQGSNAVFSRVKIEREKNNNTDTVPHSKHTKPVAYPLFTLHKHGSMKMFLVS